MALRQSIVSHYSLNEAEGNSRADDVGSNTLSEVSDTVQSYSPGQFGDAASFDAGSTRVGYLEKTSFTGMNGSAFSVAVWFNANSAIAATGQIFWKGATGRASIAIATDGSIVTRFGSFGSGYADDVWHLAVLTYDGTNYALYVDGSSIASGTSSSGVNTGTTIRLGGSGGLPTFYGWIDDLDLYSRALTSTEVSAIWNSGSGREGPYFGYSLNVSVQPSNTAAGSNMSPSPAVEILDETSTRDTSATDSITLAIGTNPGGGTLSTGTNPKAATSGVATFNTTSINNAGTGYTLTASRTGFTGATSNTFDITSASNVTVTPGTASLTLTTYAPVIKLAVIPPTASLSLTTFAPSVLTPRVCTPPTASLTLTTFAPVIALAVIPPTASLILTTFAPTVSTPVLCTPGTASLTITRYAPVIALGIIPPTATLSLSTFAPTVAISTVCTPGTAHLTLTCYAPTVVVNVYPLTVVGSSGAQYLCVAGDAASYVVAGTASSVNVATSDSAEYFVSGSTSAAEVDGTTTP